MSAFLVLKIDQLLPFVLPQGTAAIYVGQHIALIEGPQQTLVAVAALQQGYDPVLLEGNDELMEYFQAESLVDCVDALEAIDGALHLNATIDDDDEFIAAMDQLMTSC